MTQTPVKLTFEDYLNYCDETDHRFELADGELVEMPPGSDLHEAIIVLLLIRFYQEIQRLGYDWQVRPSGTGVRTSVKKSRLPDLTVMTEEQRRSMQGKSAVLESPPLLIVEVVSPESIKRDYEQKPLEYANKGILEYWIVDPLEKKVTVLWLVEGHYQETVFTGNQLIVSQTFPELKLSAEQLLSA